MKEYIERAVALDVVKRTSGDYVAAWSEIVHLPAADVAEVMHGRWVFDGGDEYADHYHCDQCGTKTDLCNEIYTEQKPNYCPNCGARMGKEDEHEQ